MYTYPLETRATAEEEFVYQDALCTIPAVIYDANGLVTGATITPTLAGNLLTVPVTDNVTAVRLTGQ